MRFGCIFFILVFTFQSYLSKAQNTPQEEAIQLFEAGKYSEALPVFKRLVTLFPKDPRYQYYSGVCMIKSNVDLNKAIDFLKFAADRSVPRDVYFYLGKAYHYLYRFNDALDAYLKFQQFGERAEKDNLQCDTHIAMARNGGRLLQKKVIFDVYKIDSTDNKQLIDSYNRNLKNGKFKEKVLKAFPFSESKTITTSRFIPSLLVKGQEVYETALGNFKKNRDLVIVRLLERDEWSRPENIGNVINTNDDEDYAYFNPGESALYFASKGHNSMGGFDIFKSVYSPDTKRWSEPVNLGFPINTPYDDFLFVPMEDQNRAMFSSNRDSRDGQVRIYTISFAQINSSIEISSQQDYIALARLKAVPERMSVTKTTKKNTSTKIDAKSASTSTPTLSSAPVVRPKEETLYPAELAEHKEYNEVLEVALRYQLQSDSMSRAAEDIRLRLTTARSDAETAKLKRDLYLLEQKAKTTQLKADELYEKARKFEIMYSAKNEGAGKSTTLTDEMARNAFSRKDDITATSGTKTETTSKPKKNRQEQKQPNPEYFIYEFRIMAKAPYDKLSDIPINQPLPEGLLYRIQMGAFSKPIEADRFRGITPISGETVVNTQITKYYAGMFSRMTDAEKALIKVRECGFKDAYVVSFFNGKSIPINRAKELEKDN